MYPFSMPGLFVARHAGIDGRWGAAVYLAPSPLDASEMRCVVAASTRGEGQIHYLVEIKEASFIRIIPNYTYL